MTAEIAILNQEAVALAADSAVTGPKIFTSANKIFSLSKYHPVGVMVYNSAQFIGGVPWETIIKSYRRDLGTERLPHAQGTRIAFPWLLRQAKQPLSGGSAAGVGTGDIRARRGRCPGRD